jgi:hypothetical protein
MFMGEGGTEQRYHAIAGVLVNRLLQPMHLGRDQVKAAIDDMVHLLWV